MREKRCIVVSELLLVSVACVCVFCRGLLVGRLLEDACASTSACDGLVLRHTRSTVRSDLSAVGQVQMLKRQLLQVSQPSISEISAVGQVQMLKRQLLQVG